MYDSYKRMDAVGAGLPAVGESWPKDHHQLVTIAMLSLIIAGALGGVIGLNLCTLKCEHNCIYHPPANMTRQECIDECKADSCPLTAKEHTGVPPGSGLILLKKNTELLPQTKSVPISPRTVAKAKAIPVEPKLKEQEEHLSEDEKE